ncbi:MAG: hypothetical protein [Podoviridae sp. ctjc_2]|nr:MAG: hypothetical protein [Podoviridae sp. ctjc_2]
MKNLILAHLDEILDRMSLFACNVEMSLPSNVDIILKYSSNQSEGTHCMENDITHIINVSTEDGTLNIRQVEVYVDKKGDIRLLILSKTSDDIDTQDIHFEYFQYK